MPSKVIRRFDYDAASGELTIRFVSGRAYVYGGVPPELAAAMRAAFAKGPFFNRHIRDRFAAREITGSPVPPGPTEAPPGR